MKCCICNKEFTGYGNNPVPVKPNGKCCDDCNIAVVIPVRMEMTSQQRTRAQVYATGNKWAIENFHATHD